MTLNSDLDDILEPILRIFEGPLKTKVSGHMVSFYLTADRELVSWGRTKGYLASDEYVKVYRGLSGAEGESGIIYVTRDYEIARLHAEYNQTKVETYWIKKSQLVSGPEEAGYYGGKKYVPKEKIGNIEALVKKEHLHATIPSNQYGKPILYEGPPMEQAIRYADERCARLVTQMADETRQRLAHTVSDAIKNKRGVDGLARDLRKTFDDMSRYRSRMIARTETADALEQAFMDRSEAMGVNGKEWIFYGGDCDICADCAAQGVVPIDFEYAHDGPDPKRPPAHPNCQCALAPAMIEAK